MGVVKSIASDACQFTNQCHSRHKQFQAWMITLQLWHRATVVLAVDAMTIVPFTYSIHSCSETPLEITAGFICSSLRRQVDVRPYSIKLNERAAFVLLDQSGALEQLYVVVNILVVPAQPPGEIDHSGSFIAP